jgi:hypothetical protein
MSLLLKFRSKTTQLGVTRETLKALARELDANETQVVHIALTKLAEEVLPAYPRDDAPLTKRQLQQVRKAAKSSLPTGRTLGKQSLF